MVAKPHQAIGYRLTYGDDVLARLAAQPKIPAGLGKYIGAFAEIHGKYSHWEKRVGAAEDARDAQLLKIAAADAAQDLKAKVDKRTRQLDAKDAAREADWADADAADAIDLAEWAVDNAELALLDAVDARARADELAKVASS